MVLSLPVTDMAADVWFKLCLSGGSRRRPQPNSPGMEVRCCCNYDRHGWPREALKLLPEHPTASQRMPAGILRFWVPSAREPSSNGGVSRLSCVPKRTQARGQDQASLLGTWNDPPATGVWRFGGLPAVCDSLDIRLRRLDADTVTRALSAGDGADRQRRLNNGQVNVPVGKILLFRGFFGLSLSDASARVQTVKPRFWLQAGYKPLPLSAQANLTSFRMGETTPPGSRQHRSIC